MYFKKFRVFSGWQPGKISDAILKITFKVADEWKLSFYCTVEITRFTPNLIHFVVERFDRKHCRIILWNTSRYN